MTFEVIHPIFTRQNARKAARNSCSRKTLSTYYCYFRLIDLIIANMSATLFHTQVSLLAIALIPCQFGQKI